MKTTTVKNNKKQVNPIIEEVFQEYAKEYKNDLSMYKFCINRISNAIKLECGLLIEFDKPSIQTRFCFGAGMYASATDEEMESASSQEQEILTKTKKFIKENIYEVFSGYDRMFEDLEKHWSLYAKCNRQNKESLLGFIVSEKNIINRNEELSKYNKLTEKDIENLKNMVEEEKAKFTKRLNSYLKRFGLSKLKTWTYIRD